MIKEYYRITGENGHRSYYKSLRWLEYYLRGCFGGLRDLEVVETVKREINGEIIDVIRLAYAHCGFYGQNIYKVELIKG